MSNIVSVKQVGQEQTYDLEIDHPDHQFYLSNGALTSNSHAVIYSFISYMTAYLKANYPVEFLLSILIEQISSNAPDAEKNVDKAKSELRRHKVKIVPPDINKSEMHYALQDKNVLLTGLDALKFVGEDAIKDILEKRPFSSFDDFMLRANTKAVRSSTIQALAAAGCFDAFKIPRRSIYLYCSDYRKKLQVWLKKHDPKTEVFEFPWPNEPEWKLSELYALEKHYLGEAFVCSKKEAYGNFFKDQHATIATIMSSNNKTFLGNVKAEIKSVFALKVKKEGSRLLGQEMAKVTIEDVNGAQGSLTIFPEQWDKIQQQIRAKKIGFEPGYVIRFAGNCNLYDNEMGIIMDQLIQSLPPLPLPKDLKAKKIALKSSEPVMEGNDLIQQIEDELFTEGLVDLNEDPFAIDI